MHQGVFGKARANCNSRSLSSSFGPVCVTENSLQITFTFLRISETLRKVEQATAVNETMVASSVIAVHSAPEALEADEGFVEPKHHFFKKKVTYEVSNLTFARQSNSVRDTPKICFEINKTSPKEILRFVQKAIF